MKVVAREMNRAGKYLFVLLLVWVPNMLANLVQEVGTGFSSNDDNGDDLDDSLDDDVSYFVDVSYILFLCCIAHHTVLTASYALLHCAASVMTS